MAEGIVRKIFESKDAAAVSSAGTHALEGNLASEFSVIAARESGIDIAGHRARKLEADMVFSSDIILCMEPSHLEHILSIDASAHGRVYNLADFSVCKKMTSIPDPYGCSLREYRECFKDIKVCIDTFLASEHFLCFKKM
jgi:protein-tyrosine phosphatase